MYASVAVVADGDGARDEIDNAWGRKYVPYFVSAVLAQTRITHSDQIMGAIGLVVHVAVWITAFSMDLWLLVNRFTSDGSPMLYLLHLAAFVTLSVAAGTVLLLTLVQMYAACSGSSVTWNDGLLPPFLSSAIVSGVRASLEFTKFLLFFSIFAPVPEVQGENAVTRHVKCLLIVVLCLKIYGVSLTLNQHRVKVYDDNHPVSLSMS